MTTKSDSGFVRCFQAIMSKSTAIYFRSSITLKARVITFIYSAMRSVDLLLKTTLIVTPVNVLHNWRHEFVKWRPSELKPLRVFMFVGRCHKVSYIYFSVFFFFVYCI